MSLRVLLAVSGPDEVRIVHGLAQLGENDVHVVRRCADLAEVLAAAAAGLADLALLDLDLRGLDQAAVVDLSRLGVTVVGYVADPARSLRTTLLGAAAIISGGDAVEQVAEVLRRAGRSPAAPVAPAEPAPADGAHAPEGARPTSPPRVPQPADRTPVRPSAAPAGEEPRAGPPPTARHGGADADGPVPGITVLWSPVGSPGRSTLAVALAGQLARRGQEQILMDADTWGASLAQMLGVLDESPGLVAACRRAANNELDGRGLDELLPTVLPGVRLLTGATAAARWPEITETGLETVLAACRGTGRHVLVDVGAPLEQDDEAAFDTFAPRRNGATLTALAAADQVLAVTRADPIGLARLLRSWDDLQAVVTAPVRVVLSQVRSGTDEREIRRLLERSLPEVEVCSLPADDAGVARALWDGATLAETVPRSALVGAVARLADALGVQEPNARRRRR